MDINHLGSLITVGLVSLIAAICPGPDFFIIMKNSLRYSRRAGMMTAFGVALALIVHLSYTVVGIAVLIQENVLIYNLMKYAGAVYLFYLGFSGLRSSCNQSSHKQNTILSAEEDIKAAISDATAVRQGILTNLLNPKAALFFISLFSQFITQDTTIALRIEYAFVNWAVACGWYLLLAYIITGKLLSKRLDGFRVMVDRMMGIALILLSAKIIFL